MLKTNASINQLAKEAADFLSKHIKIDQLILFGSYLYGTPREDSDIDIAVISEDFERMNVLKKIGLLSKVPVAVDSRLEIIGFSKKDFLNPQPASFLDLIKKKGKILI